MISIPVEIKEAYKRGEITVYQVASQIQHSPSGVYNALRRDKIDTGKFRKRFNVRNQQIVEAYRKDSNIIRVGKEFHLTKQRVHQILEKLAPEILNRRPRNVDA